jgi:hypothetical protein
MSHHDAYLGVLYIANGDATGGPTDTPDVRPTQWTRGTTPGQRPLANGQRIRVQEQIQVVNPDAVSASLDLDPDADFARGQIVIEALDVRFGSPPLATLDGDGIYVPPLPPPPPVVLPPFSDWVAAAPQPRQSRAQGQSAIGGTNYG